MKPNPKTEEERRRIAMEKISKLLTEEDFENMKKSSAEFRKNFKLRN